MKYLLSKSYSIILINIFTVILVVIALSNFVKAYEMLETPKDTLSKDYALFSIEENENSVSNIISKINEYSEPALLLKYNDSSVCGVYTTKSAFDVNIVEGRTIGIKDFENNSNVAIVDETYKEKCITIKDRLFFSLDNLLYEVVGVYKRSDNLINQDSYVYYNLNSKNVIDNQESVCGRYALDAGESNSSIVNGIGNIINIRKMKTENDMSFIEKMTQTISSQSLNLIPLILLTIVVMLNSINVTTNWIENRKKELIIRKICGATSRDIKKLIMRNYLSLVSLSYAFGIIGAYCVTRYRFAYFVGFDYSYKTILLSYIFTLLVGCVSAIIMLVSYDKGAISTQERG